MESGEVNEAMGLGEPSEAQVDTRWVRHSDWEIHRPMKVTWVGFLVAWGVVFLTILSVMVLARIGA